MMQNGSSVTIPNGNTQIPNTQEPALVKWIAHIVSFVLHPLFIPTYIMAFLLYRHPYAFAGAPPQLKFFRIVSIFFLTSFLPAFSILLMKSLGFIESIMLRTQKDRIIPYMVCMIFYFWAWYVSRNIHEDTAVVSMLLATFIASIAGMMANIYFKISMHGMAVGALFVFFVWMAFNGIFTIGSYLAIATLLTGLVCTARLIVSDHSPFEVYAGLLIGMLCQLVAIGITA
jgi:hypothetical protein